MHDVRLEESGDARQKPEAHTKVASAMDRKNLTKHWRKTLPKSAIFPRKIRESSGVARTLVPRKCPPGA